MLAESAPWTFCQNNTVMLTYSHNHAPGILLWQCSCHRNEKQNSESFFNYDANLTSVITMERKFIFFFVMLVSLYDVISCDVIHVKNFREILRYFFWILATPLEGSSTFVASCMITYYGIISVHFRGSLILSNLCSYRKSSRSVCPDANLKTI